MILIVLLVFNSPKGLIITVSSGEIVPLQTPLKGSAFIFTVPEKFLSQIAFEIVSPGFIEAALFGLINQWIESGSKVFTG